MDEFSLALVPGNEPGAVQQAIDRRLEMMARLQIQVLALRSQLNSLSPACRIPDEILAAIFLECARDCRARYDNAPWNDYTQEPYAWLTITHVCRKWREASLAHPRLWDWIVPFRPSSTEAFIMRSGQRPLIVRQRRLPSRPNTRPLNPMELTALNDTKDSMQLIYDQLYRVQYMDLYSDYPPPEDPLPDAPMLRSLTIRSARSTNELVLEYFGTLPLLSLRGLYCWADPNKLAPLLRDNLTSLALSGHLINNDALLNTLKNMEMLIALRVDDVGALHVPIIEVPPLQSALVTLPNLRYLRLSQHNEGQAAAFLLRHLSVPKIECLTVFAHIGLPLPTATASFLDSVGRVGGQDVPIVLGISTPDDNLEFSVWFAAQDLTAYHNHDKWGQPRLRYHVCAGKHRRGACLSRFALSLGERRTQVVAVFVDCSLSGTQWGVAFPTLPNIRQVYVQGEGAKLFADGMRPAPGPPQGTLIPNLHTLILDGIDWCTQEDTDVLCEDPCEVAKALASALGERGGLPQLIIRRGKRVRRTDVEHVTSRGNVNTLDWDGLVSKGI